MMHRITFKLAKRSEHAKHRLGAVIVKGGRVLSTGYNQLRPSRIIGTNTLHAEAHAVLKLLKEGRQHELVGADIHVSRHTRGGNIGMARPCKHCMDLLHSVGIRRVYYTTDFGTTAMERIT